MQRFGLQRVVICSVYRLSEVRSALSSASTAAGSPHRNLMLHLLVCDFGHGVRAVGWVGMARIRVVFCGH